MLLGVRKLTDDEMIGMECLHHCSSISGRELKIALNLDGFGVTLAEVLLYRVDREEMFKKRSCRPRRAPKQSM
jgi:hypothetical protein